VNCFPVRSQLHNRITATQTNAACSRNFGPRSDSFELLRIAARLLRRSVCIEKPIQGALNSTSAGLEVAK
jgi:hypothetical protein